MGTGGNGNVFIREWEWYRNLWELEGMGKLKPFQHNSGQQLRWGTVRNCHVLQRAIQFNQFSRVKAVCRIAVVWKHRELCEVALATSNNNYYEIIRTDSYCKRTIKLSRTYGARSPAVAERPRDASCR